MPITIENTTKVIEIPIFRFLIKKPALEIKPEIKSEPKKQTIEQKPKLESKLESKPMAGGINEINEIINRIKTQIV